MMCLMVLSLAACDPVERTLGQMESLVEDAEQNGANYTGDDWECFVAEYDALQENLVDYQGELTQEDYRLLGQLTARYQKVILAYSVNMFRDGIKSSGMFLSGYLKGLGIDGSDASVDSLIGEYADVVEDAFDDVGKLFE